MLVAAVWMTLTACGGDGSTLPVGPETPDTATGPQAADTANVADSILMKPAQLYIDSLGVTRLASARALTEDSTYLYSSVDYPDRFAWSSSAPDVLSVDENGVATSEGWGVATLTARHESGLAGTVRVVVSEAVRPAWSIPIGPGTIMAGIAVGPDGTIYAGTTETKAGRSVWSAISPQGELLWSIKLATTLSMPAIGEDGTLYFGSKTLGEPIGSEGVVTAVDPGGTVRWALEGLNGIRSSPAIGQDGTVYVAGGRHVYAIDSQGDIQWSWERAERVFFLSSPAVASDGTIYVGAEDHFLYAVNPDGSLKWMFETGEKGRIRSSPTIAADGTVYFGSYDGRLYALRPDGTERWSREMHCGLPWGCQPVGSGGESPAIGPDGTIYVGVGAVYAIDPDDGSVLWGSEPAGAETTAIVGADGTVYFGSFRGITALDAQGRMVWHYPGVGHTASIHGAPAIGVDGKIYSTSFMSSGSGGTVHAYTETDPANGGYAAAVWPSARGDRGNTGRAGG